MNIIIIKFTGILFFIGGIIHWLIIGGIMKEVTPFFITIYFHSLAVLSPAAGYGLLFLKNFGRKLGFFIAATQIPAHLTMIWLDNFNNWNSLVSWPERLVDIIFAIFFLIYFSRPKIKKIFENKD
jgi:hypothetical protein